MKNRNNYFLFDLPGQVECYVADDNLRMLFQHLTRKCKL